MAGLVVQEPEADSHDQGDPDQHGNLQDGVGGQRGKVLVQGADGGTAGVDQADTVDNLLHTQGSDKGLDLQVRNDQTVAPVSYTHLDVYKRQVQILTDNRAKLDELAQYLYQKETITGDEFMEIQMCIRDRCSPHQ